MLVVISLKKLCLVRVENHLRYFHESFSKCSSLDIHGFRVMSLELFWWQFLSNLIYLSLLLTFFWSSGMMQLLACLIVTEYPIQSGIIQNWREYLFLCQKHGSSNSLFSRHDINFVFVHVFFLQKWWTQRMKKKVKKGKKLDMVTFLVHLNDCLKIKLPLIVPFAHIFAKIPLSFDHFDCNRVHKSLYLLPCLLGYKVFRLFVFVQGYLHWEYVEFVAFTVCHHQLLEDFVYCPIEYLQLWQKQFVTKHSVKMCDCAVTVRIWIIILFRSLKNIHRKRVFLMGNTFFWKYLSGVWGEGVGKTENLTVLSTGSSVFCSRVSPYFWLRSRRPGNPAFVSIRGSSPWKLLAKSCNCISLPLTFHRQQTSVSKFIDMSWTESSRCRMYFTNDLDCIL